MTRLHEFSSTVLVRFRVALRMLAVVTAAGGGLTAQSGGTVLCTEPFPPLFPGCAHHADYAERKVCAETRMLRYVYSELKFPPTALTSGVEGTAVISFTVGVDGYLTDFTITRDPGAGTGLAALVAVERMAREGLRWEPTRSADGKRLPIRFRYHLPVKFQLR